jgi:hypothetical protein
VSVIVRDTDRGFKQLLVNVRSAQGAVRVGVDDAPHNDGRGQSVSDIAMRHEFGLGVPERSFLRSWVDENQTGIKKSLGYWVKRTLLGKDLAWRDALGKFGEYAVKGVQKKILTNIPPDLAESTVKRKQLTAVREPELALVNTGQLYDSIIYELHDKVGGGDAQ